jgi:hypothetical protein
VYGAEVTTRTLSPGARIGRVDTAQGRSKA